MATLCVLRLQQMFWPFIRFSLSSALFSLYSSYSQGYLLSVSFINVFPDNKSLLAISLSQAAMFYV